jgi:hypothetical protein
MSVVEKGRTGSGNRSLSNPFFFCLTVLTILGLGFPIGFIWDPPLLYHSPSSSTKDWIERV